MRLTFHRKSASNTEFGNNPENFEYVLDFSKASRLNFGNISWITSATSKATYANSPDHLLLAYKKYDIDVTKDKTRPRGYKTFIMLTSTEHEISTTHKNVNTDK